MSEDVYEIMDILCEFKLYVPALLFYLHCRNKYYELNKYEKQLKN